MPAEKTNFTATEIRAGVMVLASVAVLVVFVAAIRGCGTGSVEMNRFVAAFSKIDGLNLGAEVRFGGVKAGKVVDIGTDPDDRSRIRVEFEVPADVPVNHASVATIEQISLTTSKHLEVSTGDRDAPLHESGDRITSVTATAGPFGIPDLDGVVERTEAALDGLVTLLGVERAQREALERGDEMVDLAAVTASLKEALEAGAATIEELDRVVGDNRQSLELVVERLINLEMAATELLANLSAVVEENREPLNSTVTNLEQLSRDASRQVAALTESLEVTLQYLQDVSGHASDLVDNERPTLEQILHNLETTTRNLKHFSQALVDQPNVLIRGAEPRGRPDGGQ